MGLAVAPHKAAVRIQCVIALGQALSSCVIEVGPPHRGKSTHGVPGKTGVTGSDSWVVNFLFVCLFV